MERGNTKGFDRTPITPPAHRETHTKVRFKLEGTAWIRPPTGQSPILDCQPDRKPWTDINRSARLYCRIARWLSVPHQCCSWLIIIERTGCKRLIKILAKIVNCVFNIVKGRILLTPSPPFLSLLSKTLSHTWWSVEVPTLASSNCCISVSAYEQGQATDSTTVRLVDHQAEICSVQPDTGLPRFPIH